MGQTYGLRSARRKNKNSTLTAADPLTKHQQRSTQNKTK